MERGSPHLGEGGGVRLEFQNIVFFCFLVFSRFFWFCTFLLSNTSGKLFFLFFLFFSFLKVFLLKISGKLSGT